MSQVRLPIAGSGIIIEPCPATRRDTIAAILAEHSMSDLMPEPATPLAALGPAMTENYPAPSNKIRHTCFPYENSSKGKKIGRHDPKEHLEPDEKFCETVAIATLRMRNLEPEAGKTKIKQEWTGSVNLEPYDGDRERAIVSHIKHVMEYIPAGKLRTLVEDIVVQLGGDRPFDGVPLLWITPDVLPLFMPIKAKIEAASAATDHHGKPVNPTKIHVLSIVADEESARALIGMLVRNVDDEAARAQRRLAAPMSDEQIDNDLQRAMSVKRTLERYETLLEQPLTALKDRTRQLYIDIANGTMERAALNA